MHEFRLKFAPDGLITNMTALVQIVQVIYIFQSPDNFLVLLKHAEFGNMINPCTDKPTIWYNHIKQILITRHSASIYQQ